MAFTNLKLHVLAAHVKATNDIQQEALTYFAQFEEKLSEEVWSMIYTWKYLQLMTWNVYI